MAFISTDELRAGMVLARNLIGNDQRVLLRAGVALTDKHIQALHSLGVDGLYIRTSDVPNIKLKSAVRPKAAPRPERKPPPPASVARAKEAVEKMHITRPAAIPLPGKNSSDPIEAQKTDAVINEIFKGRSTVRKNTSLGEVIKLCTLRAIREREPDDGVKNVESRPVQADGNSALAMLISDRFNK